jgi:hypothetical protein
MFFCDCKEKGAFHNLEEMQRHEYLLQAIQIF